MKTPVILTAEDFKKRNKSIITIGQAGTGRAFEINKTHHLKILPEYFNAVRLGLKPFEIRKNDRNFQVGDTLILKEYKDDCFTGNIITVVVTYITDYAQKDNYVVMAIELDD